jgi:hypothetical protein
MSATPTADKSSQHGGKIKNATDIFTRECLGGALRYTDYTPPDGFDPDVDFRKMHNNTTKSYCEKLRRLFAHNSENRSKIIALTKKMTDHLNDLSFL